MSIKYFLNIRNVTKKFSLGDFENVIIDVSVDVSAHSQEYPQFSYSCGGQIQLDTSELSSDSFVAFDEITQHVLVDWLLQKEGVETVDEFSYVKYSIQNIQDRIDSLQEEESVSLGFTITNVEPQSVVEEEDSESDVDPDLEVLEP
jgi:hypothetical protein